MAGFVKMLAASGLAFASLDSLLEVVVERVVVMVAHQRTAWPFGRKFVPLQPHGGDGDTESVDGGLSKYYRS